MLGDISVEDAMRVVMTNPTGLVQQTVLNWSCEAILGELETLTIEQRAALLKGVKFALELLEEENDDNDYYHKRERAWIALKQVSMAKLFVELSKTAALRDAKGEDTPVESLIQKRVQGYCQLFFAHLEYVKNDPHQLKKILEDLLPTLTSLKLLGVNFNNGIDGSFLQSFCELSFADLDADDCNKVNNVLIFLLENTTVGAVELDAPIFQQETGMERVRLFTGHLQRLQNEGFITAEDFQTVLDRALFSVVRGNNNPIQKETLQHLIKDCGANVNVLQVAACRERNVELLRWLIDEQNAILDQIQTLNGPLHVTLSNGYNHNENLDTYFESQCKQTALLSELVERGVQISPELQKELDSRHSGEYPAVQNNDYIELLQQRALQKASESFDVTAIKALVATKRYPYPHNRLCGRVHDLGGFLHSVLSADPGTVNKSTHDKSEIISIFLRECNHVSLGLLQFVRESQESLWESWRLAWQKGGLGLDLDLDAGVVAVVPHPTLRDRALFSTPSSLPMARAAMAGKEAEERKPTSRIETRTVTPTEDMVFAPKNPSASTDQGPATLLVQSSTMSTEPNR